MTRCWDSTLTSSDEQDRGDLKPIPETKDAVAVALHQAQETDRAPKVVAAGRGTTAEQILEIALPKLTAGQAVCCVWALTHIAR